MMEKPIRRTLLSAGKLAASLSLVLCATLTATASLTDRLVSHWALDAEQGGLTPDSVGNNPMEVLGQGAFVEGKTGNAYNPSAAGYLLTRHSPDNSATGLPIYRSGARYTITMWVKGPAQTAKYIFAHGSTNNNNPLFIMQTGQAAANNAKFDVIIRSDSGATPINHVVSSAVVFDDTWHHIAWVDDAGSVKLYIDGVLDTANFSYTPPSTTYTFNTTAIGTLVRAAVSTGNIFNGAIDEVAVWNRPLSLEEVQQVMANGVPQLPQVVPPQIVSGPANVTKNVGDWHRFSVEVSGTRPLTFQWFRNNVEIPDSNTQTLLVTDLRTENSGDIYKVRVTNSGGSVTSAEATLTVLSDPQPNVRQGLVNYWPLNEIKSDNGLLTSPDLYSRNDMVLVNFLDESDVVPGQFGNALSFDYVSKFAYRTNGAPIYARSNYSVSLWVKGFHESQNDRRVFSEGSNANNNPLFTIGTDSTGATPSATVFIRDNSGATTAVVGKRSTRPVFDGTWHHVVWTDAGGQARLYIDGVLDETDYSYTRPSLTLNTTSLGAVLRAGAGNFLFGEIDEVATWERVLTWTEIQQIKNEGIPTPEAAIPVGIVSQPADRLTGVFQGDTVSFSVQTSGTAPVTFQWRKNGQPISSTSNPTATTDTLVLTNVTAEDAGEYSVVVTNAGGTATSRDARLVVTSYAAGEVVKFDVGLAGSSNSQPGFPELLFATDNGRTYNGVKVTITPVGSTIAARNRTAGAMVTNNPPALTQAHLYNDFIFANGAADGTGLEILLEGLAPNTEYELILWSFDPQSFGNRFANWTEISTGTPVTIQEGYSFNGSNLPTADNQHTMQALLTSSPQGTLLLQGLKAGGADFGVFVNALLLRVPAKEPIQIIETKLVNGFLQFRIQKQNASQQIRIEQTSDIASNSWVTATNGGVIESNGNIALAEFPAVGAAMFYRVVASQ